MDVGFDVIAFSTLVNLLGIVAVDVGKSK